jgi:hypothetical protein
MFIDKQNTVSSEQAVTAAAGSTDYIDLGAARDIGMSKQLHMCITVTETAASAGATTVTFKVQCDDNTSFSSAKTVIQSDAIAIATLVAGYQFFLPIPVGLDERYVRMYYDVAVANLSAGKFTAQVVEGIQKSVAYADAL